MNIKEFFSLNLSDYENLKIAFPIGAFLFALCAACIAAVFVTTHYKRRNTEICKQLMRHGATEPEKAKTLKELRLLCRSVKSALSRSGQITYIVKRAGEKPQTYDEYVESMKKKGYKPEKIDFDVAKFYVAPDKIDEAKKIVYSANHAWWKPAVISLGIVVFLILIMIFLPDILSAINKAA